MSQLLSLALFPKRYLSRSGCRQLSLKKLTPRYFEAGDLAQNFCNFHQTLQKGQRED